jgi:hypothetical protein
MNTVLFIYLQKAKAVDIAAGAGVGYIQSFNNSGQVPRGDFQFAACDLEVCRSQSKRARSLSKKKLCETN